MKVLNTVRGIVNYGETLESLVCASGCQVASDDLAMATAWAKGRGGHSFNASIFSLDQEDNLVEQMLANKIRPMTVSEIFGVLGAINSPGIYHFYCGDDGLSTFWRFEISEGVKKLSAAPLGICVIERGKRMSEIVGSSMLVGVIEEAEIGE